MALNTKTSIEFAQVLNPEQHAAVTHGDGPQLVLAGAGSGKTRVITYRIAWLIQERNIAPDAIAAVTFTNKAAGEMKARLEALLGVYPLTTFVGTFHRFALSKLRAYGARLGLPRDFSIVDTSDQKTLIKDALKAEGLSEQAFQPQAVLAAISSAKNRLEDPSAYERHAEDFFSRRVARVYHRYQKQLKELGAVDFDDMIRWVVLLLRQDEDLRRRSRQRLRYLLVDEFQDTNKAQLAFIHELCPPGGNLTAVGDEDQGIYRWRGAEIDHILGFENDFPGATIRKLERNYRSTQNILDASGGLIANNLGRRGKRLWTDSGAGELLLLYRARDEQDEARWVANTVQTLRGKWGLAHMAVLVRTHAQTRSFEEEFLRQRLPYALIGGLRFYERAEIKDLIAYLRLLHNPHDMLSFNRVLNRPARGIGDSTHQLLLERATERGVSAWTLLEEGALTGISPRGVRALLGFRDLIRGLITAAASVALPTLLRQVLDTTAYLDLYSKGDDESEGRLENIREFLSAAQEFSETHVPAADTPNVLTAFLDHVSLASAEDRVGDGQMISLMTLHSAKGLEFAVVVVAGIEGGILPHFNARTPADLEEERRLLYVGMTRARQRLLLTCCQRRRVAGLYKDQEESPFLAEIPERYVQCETSPELFAHPQWDPQADNVYSFFGRHESTRPPQPSAPTRSSSAVSTPSAVRTSVNSAATPGPASSSPSPSNTASGQRFRRGSLVRHAKLGQGRILSVEGSGEDTRLLVHFERQGTRKLIARFAPLEIL